MTLHLDKALSTAALAALLTMNAQAIPLTDLLNGGTLQAGDKLFDQWELIGYDTSEAGRTFDSGNIDVTTLNDGGLDPGPGLNFNVLNGELSVEGNGIFAYVDLSFGFRVTALEPQLFIKDASLDLIESSVSLGGADGDAGITIVEVLDADEFFDFSVAPSPDIGSMLAQVSENADGSFNEPSASSDFAPRKSVFVTKNILVWATLANNEPDFSNLFQFQQRYSQIERTVPEPSSLALALLAVSGVGSIRRLRRK